MDAASKEELLEDARKHLSQTIQSVDEQIPLGEKSVADSLEELKRNNSSQSTALTQRLLAIRQLQLAHLQAAKLSPYFARCDVDISDQPEQLHLYFGKFSVPELNIYSWATPAARIRFNEPGQFAYTSETDREVSGILHRVDQYMIAQQEIRFMTTAATDKPRTLVYQERFSTHKSEFVLPEIVERMEKAQDDIIRANAYGSFLISGPAGSGKTTLALHRIAFLLQSPEHADKFDPRKILVLVQDKNSKQYFENLLPSLGIVGVSISTFDIWAMDLLGIKKAEYVPQYGRTERERDFLAASKYRALKSQVFAESRKDPFTLLESAYGAHFSDDQKKIFARQKKEKRLDRFDLTLLLQARLQNKGVFTVRGRIYTPKVKGGFTSRVADVELSYSLILVDEVQNYLPEQIAILQSCISKETRAMTYVGDLAQQTSLFTLRDWSQVGEQFADGRAVQLYKVYRSTRQILAYIRSAGFAIEIPDGIRDGKDVQEHTVSGDEAFATVRQIVKDGQDILVGIIGMQEENVQPYKMLASERCKVMTAFEAQGLEFDVVVFIRHQEAIDGDYADDLRLEKQKVIRDQIYVALTRAMNELHVVVQ